jgi:hypothetical protein
VRVEDARLDTTSDMARLTATIVWEDCDRPPQEIYFGTSEEFACALRCNPHVFLITCLLPAMRHGERRIAIEDRICPELRNGLLTAIGLMRNWYEYRGASPRIEARAGIRAPAARESDRAGSFLSGGVDSLALLRLNRHHFPLNHPRSVKDCLFVYGLDIGGWAGTMEHFEFVRTRLLEVVEDAGVTLIPVYTNLLQLDDDMDFWMHEFHGAALAGIAHAFSGRLSDVSLASSFAIPNLGPWGSHPLLDPSYSSTDFRVRHDNLWLSRLEKVRLVADWDAALRGLRVCTWFHPGMLNCGKCDKCIRTMTELLAVGKLEHTQAFPVQDVTAELLDRITITKRYQGHKYRELLVPLRARGRDDLADVIEAKLDRLPKYLAWKEERDWKGSIKRFDRRALGGRLCQLRGIVKARTGV